MARAKEHHVGRLIQDFNFQDFENLGDLRKQAYVALRAFQQGLSVSANLLLNGWDTHAKNDLYQTNKMNVLFRALTYIKDAAETLIIRDENGAEVGTVADRLNIVVGSDFGRTTHYSSVGNVDSGKDHHPVTSWMTMLWHQNRDSGLRVIGETTDAVLGKPLNAQLQPSADGTGVVMTPALIHNELRRLGGLGQGSVADLYPLQSESLTLWS